jgi:hypothetical protein
MGPEKSTYFVYQRGIHPADLKLGNLVIDPANPKENEPYKNPLEQVTTRDASHLTLFP